MRAALLTVQADAQQMHGNLMIWHVGRSLKTSLTTHHMVMLALSGLPATLGLYVRHSMASPCTSNNIDAI